MTKPKSLPTQAMQASVVPGSINAKARTVDVIWSTGAKIGFFDWEIGEYNLTLALEPENVRLDFARSGAPVLDAHNSAQGVEAVKGVIDAIDTDGKVGTATLRLSTRPEVDSIWADIEGGILRFVSVGTRLHKLEDITEEGEAVPHYRAIDHEPLEISLAPIPKDRGAVMQADRLERFPVDVVFQSAHAAHNKGGQMANSNEKSAASSAADEITATDVVIEQAVVAVPAAAAPEKANQAELEKAGEKARGEERVRVQTINKIAKQAGLDAGWAGKMIAQGTTTDEVRRLALDSIATQDDSAGIRPHVTVGIEDRERVRLAVTSAILHRTNPTKFALTDGGADFVGMSLLEIGRDLLHKQGVATRGLPRHKLAEQAMQGSSDFPEILANVGGKALRIGYEESPRTFTGWARQATASDFKQMSRTQLGEAPSLELVQENGAFTHGAVGEAAEKYSLATYGKIVAITRQAIINDDLGAFDRIIPQMGGAASRLESDLVYGILTANAAMADGIALFHASHGNLSASAAAPSVTTLSAARAAMRVQTGLDGSSVINVEPAFLIVPAAYETAAQQTVASIVAADTDKVNPFAASLVVVAEPRLDGSSATDWYLAGRPGQIDTVEYAYLEGTSGPYIESRNGFDVDGVEIKVRHDFAAKAIDHRGLYLNS